MPGRQPLHVCQCDGPSMWSRGACWALHLDADLGLKSPCAAAFAASSRDGAAALSDVLIQPLFRTGTCYRSHWQQRWFCTLAQTSCSLAQVVIRTGTDLRLRAPKCNGRTKKQSKKRGFFQCDVYLLLASTDRFLYLKNRNVVLKSAGH